MMTSSNGNIFRVTGPLCGEFTGPGEFHTQRPVTRSFDVFFDLRLNKRLSKQPWGWWFETLSWSLWRQCNEEKYTTTQWTLNISRSFVSQLHYTLNRHPNIMHHCGWPKIIHHICRDIFILSNREYIYIYIYIYTYIYIVAIWHNANISATIQIYHDIIYIYIYMIIRLLYPTL